MSCLLFVAFWWKEVVFFSSFRPVQAIAVPRPVVLSTGSNGLRPYYDWAVACSVQHWAWSTLPVRSLSRCSPTDSTVLYHCSEDLPLNCCNCSAADRAQRLEWVRRQLDPPATFLSILSRNVQLSTNDGAFARRLSVKRYAHDRREKFATPKSIFFTCPNISHVWKLEKPTINDNAKQQKRKIEDNSNCLQPLACAQASHSVFKQAGERPAFRSPGWNHRCPRPNKRHFFIAQSRGWPRPIHFLWQKSPDMP